MFNGGGSTRNKYESKRSELNRNELDLSSHCIKYHSMLLLDIYILNFFIFLSLSCAQGRAHPPPRPHPPGATARPAHAPSGAVGGSRGGQLLPRAAPRTDPQSRPPRHPERAGGREVGAARLAPAAHLVDLAVEPPLQPHLLGMPPLDPPPQREDRRTHQVLKYVASNGLIAHATPPITAGVEALQGHPVVEPP